MIQLDYCNIIQWGWNHQLDMVDIDGSTYLCVYVLIVRWNPYMDSLLLHVELFNNKLQNHG